MNHLLAFALLASAAVASVACEAGSEPRSAPPASSPKPRTPLREVELASTDPSSVPTSLVRIIANPHPLHGRSVGVAGYLRLGFEANHLCVHKDDVDYGIVTNCIWVDVPERQDLEAFSNRYVVVQGLLDSQPMNLAQARLTNVRSITLMRNASTTGDPKGGEH